MDHQTWDERYGAAELVWSAGPNQFLVSELEGAVPGRALDLACGEGRNAIWLAEQGWEVTGVDFSAVGLAKAARIAEGRGVRVRWVEADVTSWEPPPGAFDLVAVFYLQLAAGPRRVALARAAAALAPGGTLLVVAHDADNLVRGVGGPQDPTVLYDVDEVVGELEEEGLAVEKAARVERPVATEEGTRHAVDTLVRAVRAVRAVRPQAADPPSA